MDGAAIAARLTAALGLDSPPIALTFADAAPAGVANIAGEAPSACSFWRKAEGGAFFATAAQHFNCPIGAMTMGFALPESIQQELMTAVTLMCDVGYIGAQEPEQIPHTGTQAGGIAYGPLADFPLSPELVLLWLTPRQAMLFSEAAGDAHWTTAAPASVRGRPACAALPLALSASRPLLSLGCMGMRTFTEIAEDRLLAVLPGGEVGNMAVALERVQQANETMRAYYAQKKAAFAG